MKSDFYHNRGFAFWKLKDYQKAIDDYTKAIDLNPNHFKAYYNWAFCYDKLNKFDLTEKDYVSAVNI